MLIKAGNRFAFITAPGCQPLATFRRQLDLIAAQYRDAAIAVECPNQINYAPVF